MSQHHPEYVSLVWGAIKFCFISIINREVLVAQLSKALAQIADALPRAALTLVLFPTEMMRNAVATIYAQVTKFLIWALNWYSEGRLKHMYHVITQPFSPRYKDILEEIQTCSRTIESVVSDAAQAEVRDMHIIIRELKKIAVEHYSLTSTRLLNTNRQLSELQVSEIITFVATTPLL
ncbi:hypothetical protein VE01_08884 [Pseudogymnoascus verrucosus]|uniref:DUF7708 domain-containing protein n=1 Tax=Pseudogymnoascus verrucosus TaxID=342668 RepID=A0A1B8GAT0_9PEZI|nr:uncharacterized protein VE01_08884 [Pseudogymnoascus verrucosus]OBT92949.1 hypothetical protein VE01_08884 [Pseudogymnoascus verrucosus]